MLELVKAELEENLEDLKEVHKKWQGELHTFQLLKGHLNNLEDIPADTLKKYQYTLTSVYPIEFKNDSYEVLKNSILLQYIKEKT